MPESDFAVIQNSMLWSAYGDALGFITELVSKERLKTRIADSYVTRTTPWKYVLGGRLGVNVTLPAGCYSDDTQLRLATSRAIRGDGKFDIEAFAKIELPVWLSYALGAGRGTKAAAENISRSDINWFSNFFKKDKADYLQGGGNGAAMRIQPHVYALQGKAKDWILRDVVRNAIITHGHPRGILGAVFHALCLDYVLTTKQIPGPVQWKEFVRNFASLREIIKRDDMLGSFWLPVWQERFGRDIESAFREVGAEILKDINHLTNTVDRNVPESCYSNAVKKLDATSSEQRGSGTKTALLAAYISWLYGVERINEAMLMAANTLFSDTDSIASMAGALLGAISIDPPREQICDRPYIEQESIRLFRISQGDFTESFAYPDVFAWKAPSTHADALGKVNGSLAVAGLGLVESEAELLGPKKQAGIWQWVKLDFGQTLLIKRRQKLSELPKGNVPKPPMLPPRKEPTFKIQSNVEKPMSHMEKPSQLEFYPYEPKPRTYFKDYNKTVKEKQKTIDELTKEAIESGFDPVVIGSHILEIGMRKEEIELAAVYAGIVVKAFKARKFVRSK